MLARFLFEAVLTGANRLSCWIGYLLHVRSMSRGCPERKASLKVWEGNGRELVNMALEIYFAS